jgi:hypothetical protein
MYQALLQAHQLANATNTTTSATATISTNTSASVTPVDPAAQARQQGGFSSGERKKLEKRHSTGSEQGQANADNSLLGGNKGSVGAGRPAWRFDGPAQLLRQAALLVRAALAGLSPDPSAPDPSTKVSKSKTLPTKPEKKLKSTGLGNEKQVRNMPTAGADNTTGGANQHVRPFPLDSLSNRSGVASSA